MAYHARGDAARAKPELERAVAGTERYPGIEEARATLEKIP
jgi:hypothetical protein